MTNLLHPSDPRAPKYWQGETSGVLAPAIEAYLYGEELSDSDVAAMRAYLRQWIQAPVWAGGSEMDKLQRDVENIGTRADIDAWLQAAEGEGIDPL